MVVQAGQMYRPTDITVDTSINAVYVVEQFSHRISKWNYTPGSFDFILDAGHVTSIDFSGGAGTLYSLGDPVIISAPTLDILNPVNATAQVSSVGGSGDITGINITNEGNGYDPNNLPTVDAPTTGTSAVLVAVVSTPWGNNGDGTTGESGRVTSVTDNALDRPTGIVINFDNTRLFVTDTFHNRIRVIDIPTGRFLGSAGKGGSADDGEFYHPTGISKETITNFLIIADELNHRAVRYVDSTPPLFLSVLPAPTLSFIRPHGVVIDVSGGFVNVTDTLRSLISRYNNDASSFIEQYGTPGTTGTDLFFPGSGEGLITGTTTTAFADTRNNILKTVTGSIIANTTGTTAGTGDGQLYYPESVSSFDDSANYVLAANTLNNRVEVFTNSSPDLTFQANFGSPSLIPTNWFNTSFKRRVPITINSSQITGTHTNFPFLFNSTLADLVGNVLSDGGDIRFALSDKTELKSEIQFIDDTTGELIAWTKVPLLQTATSFFMYYDNSGASLPTDPENVWPGYDAVYHMQDAVVSSIKDSTTNSSYIQGFASSITGQIGNGLDFTGSNAIETDSAPAGDTGWLSIWVNPDDVITDQYMMEYRVNRFALLVGFQDNNFNFFMYPQGANIAATQFPATTSNWQKIDVVVTRSPARVRIYKNGIQQSDGTDVQNRIGTTSLSIGAAKLAVFLAFYNGQLDELEFISTIPSSIDDRILGRFNIENNPNAFYTIGAVETIP